MSPSDDYVDEVLGSFYGNRRAWSLAEKGAAKALVDHHRWTPILAGCVADWLEQSPDGHFWRSALTERDGVVKVLKSVGLIMQKSGASSRAPGRSTWDQERQYKDTVPEEQRALRDSQLGPERQVHIEEQQRDWGELIDEAHARGLKGPAMARWVFEERERRTGVKGIAKAASGLFDAMVRAAGRPETFAAQRGVVHVQPQRAGNTAPPKRARPEQWEEEPRHSRGGDE